MNSGEHAETLTFLFTDIEGSSALWQEQPGTMREASARHDVILRSAVERNHGDVVKMTGDGLHAAFHDPRDAVAAAVELQRLLGVPGSTGATALLVRCGMHTGAVELRDGDFFGSAVNRAARVANVAHGGQILVSQATALLTRDALPDGVSLRDVGEVRLRGMATPERVYQVLHGDLREDFPAPRSLEANPNNLPQQATRFIGREREITQLKDFLGRTRLLTLTGSGGVGKTRLAIQVAAALLESYPDGVWLIELAPLSDPDLAVQTAAAALGLKEQPPKTLTQTLVEHLKPRQLLLVLDNAEHLLAACAQLADALLRKCPQVALLVTSREPLGAAGEVTYRVPSLTAPDPKSSSSIEALTQYAAVQLFIDRALAVKSSFQVNNANAPAVASICHHLDGIPLAIELAAARMRSMAVEEVNQRLDQRFRLLTSGSRTSLPRQQTLRSLIDWSYDLLNDDEKALLCRVSVFSSGCTLEAAEHVCVGEDVDEDAVLDLLTSLVDKSLVIAEERNGATRYRLLETVRQYAADRLLESGEGSRWRDRHLSYWIAVAEEAEPWLSGSDQHSWLDRLETEHDNLRSALAWSSEAGGDGRAGLRLASALWRFWFLRGYFGEGRGWLSGLLAAAPGEQMPAVRANALGAAGTLALRQGDYAAARAAYDESLAIRRELGDRPGVATLLISLGNVAMDHGDFPAAQALYEESLAIRRELGDQRGIAGALRNLGSLAQKQGDCSAARAMCEQSVAIHRDLGNRWEIAISVCTLGYVRGDQGDYEAARALHEEALRIHWELDNRWIIAEALEAVAGVVSVLEEPFRAPRIWGAAERLREDMRDPRLPADRVSYDREVASARAAAGDDSAFDSAWQEGRAMTLEQAVEYALKKHQA